MRRKNMIIAFSGAILLFAISILYFLLSLGKPLGYLAWGGKYFQELPKELRIKSAVSIPGQLFAIYILLKLGNVFTIQDEIIILVFGYVFMIFFLINTVLNVLSKSNYEKYIMTPIALWIALWFAYVLFIQ